MPKTNTNYEEIFRNKKAMMEVVEKILDDITYRENSLMQTYEKVGEEQRKDKDGNLLYLNNNGESTTVVTDTPYMRSIYEDVTRTEDALDENEKSQLKAYQKIREELMGLI